MNSLTALQLPHPVDAPQLAIAIGLISLAIVHGFLTDGRRVIIGPLIVALSMLITSALAGFSVTMAGPSEWILAVWQSHKLSLIFDPLSCLMLGLVGFLGLVITLYARNYLDGDPQQGRFMKWLAATQLSVATLIVCGNFLIFMVAWAAISFCLHQLLTLYPERLAARVAANKKFIISRLGDLCLLLAAMLIWHQFGTFEFSAIFKELESVKGSPILPWICGCLAAAALIKSAQFPFHSWLPDTLETPTPVSALMHAGIINAGGYLVLRMSPLLVMSPDAMNGLAVMGAFTALFGSVIMMTQTSIKKSLAWSTIAQMGFMMLQCGLGAFALAMLHVVAHSLYKAYAFLSSGSIVGQTNIAWVPTSRPAAHPKILLGALFAAISIGSGAWWLMGDQTIASSPGEVLLLSVFVMALAHLLWTLWSSSMRRYLLSLGLGVAALTASVCLLLHAGFNQLLSSSLPIYHPVRDTLDYTLLGLVALLFLGVLVFQSQLPAWSAHPALARFYVHAANGFYLGTYLNRLTKKLGV